MKGELKETSLVEISAFQQALTEATNIPDVKNLLDQVDLFRQWIKKQRVGREAQNKGAEMCLLAQRRLGEMLGDNSDIQPGGDRKSSLHSARMKLSDLGIEPTASHRWHIQPTEMYNQLGCKSKADCHQTPWECFITLKAIYEDN